jgi:hypothetical protein
MVFLLSEQLRQLVDSAAPARGVALDCISAPESLVADDEFRASAVRRDGDAYFGFNAGMFVGRFYDPGEDNL